MKKNLFLRLCLILFTLFYLQSCRNDYYDQTNYQTSTGKSAFRLVKLSQIPHITAFIKKESGRKDLSLSFKKESSSGNLAKAVDMSGVKIETQTIVSVERNNATYYVFRISGTDSQENTTFYNLEVKETGGSAVNAQIIEYNSDVGFSENPLLQMQNFTGTVTTYSLDGELSSRYSLDDGTGECPPEGYYPPQDGGSSDPPIDPTTDNPGIPGEWDPGFGFPGTGGGGGDTPSNPDDCWEIVTVPTQPWRTLGWQNACTGEWIDNPAENGGNMENNGTGILNSGCGDGSGTVIVPGEVEDPCKKAKASITAANNVLKNPDVQTKMDAVLRGKTQAPNEWGVAIGQKTNGYEVTNVVEGIPGEKEVTIPVSQLTTPLIGDGHSHAGAAGRPSGGDLYEMLKVLLTHTDFKYRYVYGDYFGVPENYALIINDRNAAIAFLGQFPRSENYDELNHSIRRDSPLGREFYRAFYHVNEGRSDNTSGEVYDSGAIAMAYILEKYNSGISISKADANGTLKKINATVQQITVPGNGTVKEGVKVSKCP